VSEREKGSARRWGRPLRPAKLWARTRLSAWTAKTPVTFVSGTGVGPGRRDSDSVTWELASTAKAADGQLELPTDDNTVCVLRSGISFPVPDPDSLDPSLFALAVLTVLNKMPGLDLTPDGVFVREVTSTGVLFEVRVPRDQKDRVAEMCRNPLFLYPLYPLALQLYDVGLINATDSRAAVTQMSINASAWQALVAQPAGLSTGATVALAKLFPLLVLAQSVAFKRLRLRDRVLTARASVLEKQEQVFVKREQELKRRLVEIEAQQQAALSEKAALPWSRTRRGSRRRSRRPRPRWTPWCARS
jgi:hypothetical protein